MGKAAPLFVLALLMVASMAIGVLANRAASRGGFLQGYFLGNRALGSWSMALTATVMSGGTFMGFPSYVYQYGWVVALWIGSYMVVAICTFGVLGKRMGQLSRVTGAITVPELLRERFASPALGLVASLVLILILSVSLVAQFKAGALILQEVLAGAGWVTGTAPPGQQSPGYLIGLLVFTLVVVSYTLYGGFLAAVWTDLFQSILMAVGVLILFPLALIAAGGLEAGTAAGIAQAGPGYATAPGLAAAPAGGVPHAFLPLSLVFSYFCLWSIAGMGQPATLVRLMAFRETRTLRQALFLLAVYNTLIYLPLLLTFICARQILPGLESSDRVMPRLAMALADPAVAGLILAAPFGAVMATVSGYLVQIASGVVEDIYRRWLRPGAGERTLRWASYLCMVVIALLTAWAAVRPPEFLQAVIVFAGGSVACAYLFPAAMAAFWPRATARGALASMIGGVGIVVGLYLLGLATPAPTIGEKGNFYPYYLLGLAPFVWGMLASVVLGISVSLTDRRPDRALVARFFETAA